MEVMMGVFLNKTKRLQRCTQTILTLSFALAGFSGSARAGTFFFSTGSPDGKIATLSRLASPGKLETETADDFITPNGVTTINSAIFTGLIPLGTPLSAITQVEIELYHVFPIESTDPPDGRVITRMNSPSDNNFDARDSNVPGQLSFTATMLNPAFNALNSVVNGIHAMPNQFTGGEGAVTGEEVQFSITFTTPFVLGEDHVFFRPEVLVTNGDFLWLSAPRPIVPPGTPFANDLQSWIRNDGAGALFPDWERIGTDVTGQGPFNASFSLIGTTVPEPETLILIGGALTGLGVFRRRSNKRSNPRLR
jgi:hypothetical protein